MSLFARRPSRSVRCQILTLEQLEDRTLPSVDLLITAEVPGTTTYELREYTQQGSAISLQPIPQAPGANETKDARGLSVSPSGDVNIFDGTFSPSLATYSPTTGSWSFQTTSGWSTINTTYNGEVAAYNNYVFASDQATASSGGPNGLIRFDSTGTTAPVRFASGTDFQQVTLGLDGLLYGFVGSNDEPHPDPTIEVFNPDTLALVRTVTLNTGSLSNISSIAVDASGNIYAAELGGTLDKYDANGNPTGASLFLQNPQTGGGERLQNVALDSDGTIAVGGADGDIFLTNESMTSVQNIIRTNLWNVFVTFDHYIGGAAQTVTPSFSTLAGPTITYGQSSVTLGGQISAGAAYPPGSVNITVNGVTETAAINPNDGTFSATFDTSSLGASGSPYTITYSYPGEGNYAALTDSSQVLTVNQAATTLTNLSSPTAVYGTPNVTLSGTVGSNSILPVGQLVNLTVTNSQSTVVASGSGTINSNGQFAANINTAALAVGSYTIQYSYAGDNNFQGSSDNSQSLSISQATTTLSNLSSPAVVYGTPTATLSGTLDSNSVLPVGQSVTATILGANGPLASGSGTIGSNGQFAITLNTAGLSAGSYTIQYSYAGDNNFAAVSNSSKSLTISQATTSLSNLSSPTIVYGTQATFSGTVGSNSVLPVGQSVTVLIKNAAGTVASGTGIINSNGNFQVSIDTSKLSAGSYTIQYSYAGDNNFAAISDSSKSLTISQATTSLSNLSSPKVKSHTSKVTLSGTVGSNSILPVGQIVTVTIKNSKGVVVASGSGVIGSNGSFQVSINTSKLAVGSYTILYSYAGDNNFKSSSGTGVLQVVHG